MSKRSKKYANYVEHPKYGQSPLFTYLVPSISKDEKFVLVTRPAGQHFIENTAILANLSSSSGSAYLVKYYVDEDKFCIDCDRPFIFFAQEQKYLFDELGLSMQIKGRRCYDCRKKRRILKQEGARYAELKHIQNRSLDETIEMADICLKQMEAGLFNPRQTQTVRALLNKLTRDSNKLTAKKRAFIGIAQSRLASIENKFVKNL